MKKKRKSVQQKILIHAPCESNLEIVEGTCSIKNKKPGNEISLKMFFMQRRKNRIEIR